jgi:hypothetical protein
MAIADWQLGRAYREAGQPDKAQHHLASAIVFQAVLDKSNPEYAEYRYYLVKMWAERVQLPDGYSLRAEYNDMRAALLDRDPERWEYQQLPKFSDVIKIE